MLAIIQKIPFQKALVTNVLVLHSFSISYLRFKFHNSQNSSASSLKTFRLFIVTSKRFNNAHNENSSTTKVEQDVHCFMITSSREAAAGHLLIHEVLQFILILMDSSQSAMVRSRLLTFQLCFF